ncbi:zinc finger BED domain-containing protein RICESLEEPER 2-like [Heracleum sosnowskyi]|uniref:Zinc finger BED domain-containing protein RICESLEEPER 2-like n=1 Tax=Heracleum sosnowskyi TaxID=360622 RepID=A0AAD8HH49_9APIA|nr:zinc finger BED domain-containing protein RICESLEEPER 2-like [Heracleum sosnowskyi]
MAKRMLSKFEKYWENYKNINFLLYIAVVLDPRYKLRYVQFCFSQIYSQTKCTEMIVLVETKLNKLFKYYEEEHANVSCSSGSNVDLHEPASDDLVRETSATTSMAAKFLEQMNKNDQHENKSDLCKYLSDTLVKRS